MQNRRIKKEMKIIQKPKLERAFIAKIALAISMACFAVALILTLSLGEIVVEQIQPQKEEIIEVIIRRRIIRRLLEK